MSTTRSLIVSSGAVRARRGSQLALALAFALLACLSSQTAARAAASEVTPPSTLPPATYPTTFSEQRFIRMDDGIELGATITFPSQDGKAAAPGRFPAVLNITPY